MRSGLVIAALGMACSANDAPAPHAPGDGGVVEGGRAWRDEPPIDPASLFVGPAPFKDVAAAAGLPAIGGMCVVFEDFDGDAKPDIFLASFFGAPQAIALYLNDGAGHFAERPLPKLALEGTNAAPGWCAAGDVDGDGKLDVVLASFASFEAHVLRNAGGGTFADAQKLTAAGAGSLGFAAIALADLDGDGRLDLVAAPIGPAPLLGPDSCAPAPDGFRCESPGKRCAHALFVFRNTGAAAPFAPAVPIVKTDCGPAHVNALTIADWNDDGLPDVFASNDWGTNAFYLNGPGMTFTDVLPTLGTKPYNSAMGAAIEDFDLDGKLDLYVADMGSDQFYPGGPTHAAPLVDKAGEWGIAPVTRFHSGWAPLAEDFDSDGLLDVFVANSAFTRSYNDLAVIGSRGLPETIYTQYDILFHGEGGRFKALGARQSKAAEATPMFGAAAVADFDGDGRLDILETIGYPLRVQLLHNEGPRGHWLRVRLRGRAPNVDGIGATVTLRVPGAPLKKRYVQRMRGTNGSSWATLHFGLGAGTAVDVVDVRWPSGRTQTIASPRIDAVLEISEPD